MSAAEQVVLRAWSVTGLNVALEGKLDEFPLGVSVVSLVVILLRSAVGLRKLYIAKQAGGQDSDNRAHLDHLDQSSVIVAHKLARLVGCIAFFGLSISTLLVINSGQDVGYQYVDAITGLYACILAVLSVKSSHSLAAHHLNCILISLAVVYIYQDIIPLAQVGGIPFHISEGLLLWAKLVDLLYIALAAPLITPRPYVPVDPLHPQLPHPEQTASVFSFILFSWLDSVIAEAQTESHQPIEMMHPLADYDAAGQLREHAFKYLDVFSGARKQHAFFGLMRTFSKEYTAVVFLTVLEVMSNFLGPIGINRLLHYLEVRDDSAEMYRPWVWVLWIFLGPVISAITFEYYCWISTRISIRAESIITQLAFEHALRVRLKADAEPMHDSHVAETIIVSSSPSQPTASTQSTKNFLGRLNNMVTTDLKNISEARELLKFCSQVPLTIMLCIIFLYQILGWSAFVGLGIIIVTIPVPGIVTKIQHDTRSVLMKKTDARVQTVSEVLSSLRMVKLFGWERKMAGRIDKVREEELELTQKVLFLRVADELVVVVIPMLTLVMKEPLNASKVFSSMVIFTMFASQMGFIMWYVTVLITGKVSLDRLTDFLQNTELLDQYSTSSESLDAPRPTMDIGFHQASFTWSEAEGSSRTRNFVLRIPGNLEFKRGHINIVIGPTGSGKTSLLMALLGEMHLSSTVADACYHLPRDGGVAYAAQESWVLNDTIKNNIVFGNAFDDARYEEVLRQCALRRDLSLFDAGDDTEVGEKGITLSGGQKARITLARAIYSYADIILLDDVLAALDVHTSKWIVTECLQGPLVRGRTVILVTHNIAIVKPIAEFVVLLKDGAVESQGSLATALAHNVPEVQEEAEARVDDVVATDSTEAEKVPVSNKSDGKLILAEEIQMGHLSWSSLKLYLTSLSGKRPILYFTTFFAAFVMLQVFVAMQTWYLGYWAEQYELVSDPMQVSVLKCIGVFSLISLAAFTFNASARLIQTFGSIRASRKINRELVDAVLGTTLRWLDVTPVSRIITRCTADIQSVDTTIGAEFANLTERTLEIVVKFCAVIIFTPLFGIPGVVILALGYWIGQYYMKAQLAAKRERSNSKAPVVAHFGASVAGIISIRAYGVQERFIEESRARIDRYTRIARTHVNLNRWVAVRIEMLGICFTTGLAAYLVYATDSTASNTGFSLNMAVGFSGVILQWIRIANGFEVECNSLERIHGYLEIEQEVKPTKDGVPPAYWPSSGSLSVEKLSARYSPDGPKVLKDISFTVRTGERIGIVGRTGSGKSSLTLALLRCIYTEGSVHLDGLETSSLNLDELRSRITIIPQVPELLSASVRENLDPFGQYDDVVLNDSLRSAGLAALQEEMAEGKITLESMISGGGANLSVGQRQILALARALVRGSKLLILDEATSAIDYTTDGIIQTSLRTELKSDTTLITVAHRLQTVMDADKIMVLDAGNIVEYDTPKNLLAIRGGKLRALVDESSDKYILYSTVEGSR